MTDTASSPEALAGKTVAVVGGTGQLGAALVGRWSRAGVRVVIGSREAAAATAAAAALSDAHPAATVSGMTNEEAAAIADVIVVTVPFAAQEATLNAIAPHVAGKLVVDTTVPLVPPRVMRVQLPPAGSAAQQAQRLLGEATTVISGFHNVAAAKLATDDDVACDVLVFGDDPAVRGVGVALAEAAGLRGLHAGALANSAAAEALTSVLIFLNKTYRVNGAGLRITGDLQF